MRRASMYASRVALITCGSKFPVLDGCAFYFRSVVEGKHATFGTECISIVGVIIGGHPRCRIYRYHYLGPKPERLRVVQFFLDSREPMGCFDRGPELLRLCGRRLSRRGGSIVLQLNQLALVDVS